MEKGKKIGRLIDIDEAYKVLTDYYHHKTEIQHKALKEAIGGVPSIDAVEVVRCKDCVNCSECITDDGMYIYIRCLRNGATIYEDDFCSWGERREDEDNRC